MSRLNKAIEIIFIVATFLVACEVVGQLVAVGSTVTTVEEFQGTMTAGMTHDLFVIILRGLCWALGGVLWLVIAALVAVAQRSGEQGRAPRAVAAPFAAT